MNTTDTGINLTLILSLCFNIFLTIIHLLGRKDKRKELKSKLTEEMIAINTLAIQYPELNLIYEPVGRYEELKEPNDVQRVLTFSYKYLNLLNKIDDYYSIVKHLNNPHKLNAFINNNYTFLDKIKYKDPKQLRDWLIFYRKSFKEGIIGHKFMKETVSVDNITNYGEYSIEFARFVRLLLPIEDE
ncbi:MAG: hypothetical protein HOO91_07280 [Bacteroidales bacterium]|nr:hypothetical protein [Bacteroidales bacterium]